MHVCGLDAVPADPHSGKLTAFGRYAKHEEDAVGDELAALAVAGLATIATMVAMIVVGLQAPPLE